MTIFDPQYILLLHVQPINLLFILDPESGVIIPEPVPEPIDAKKTPDTFVELPPQGPIIPEPVPEPIDTKQAPVTFVKVPPQGPVIPEAEPEIEKVSTEVCCKKAGVPQMCMGLCMDPMGPASRNFPKWTSACAQHEQAIENCFAPVETKTPIIPEPKLEPKTISPEVCCKNGGVPQMCMGLCMDPKGPASRNLPKSWINACEQHEETIEKCFTSGMV